MERSHAKSHICSMRLLLITILIVYSFKGFSQFDGSSTSIISLSGLAYQNIEQDVFSSMNIISSISTIKKKQVGIYSENRFMIKGLAKVQGVLTIPSKKSGFGMQVEYQGINNMNFAGIAAGFLSSCVASFSLISLSPLGKIL